MLNRKLKTIWLIAVLVLLLPFNAYCGLDWYFGYFFNGVWDDGHVRGETGFKLTDVNGENIPVEKIELIDPAFNVFVLDEYVFPLSYKYIPGSYNAGTGQWTFNDILENTGEHYLAVPETITEGDYTLRVTDINGTVWEAQQYHPGQIDLPVISSLTFRGGFDEEGNFIAKWEAPCHVTQDVDTRVKAFIDIYDTDENYMGMITCKLPTQMSTFFVTADAIAKARSLGSILKIRLYLSTKPSWNRTLTASIDLNDLPPLECTQPPDEEPPEVSLRVRPRILWPPSGKMIKVRPVFTLEDNADPNPSLELLSITMTDGSTTVTYDPKNVDPSISDIFINDIGKIFLKADRNYNGKGRTYTFNYAASDSAGNRAETSAKVVVPHWRSFFLKK